MISRLLLLFFMGFLSSSNSFLIARNGSARFALQAKTSKATSSASGKSKVTKPKIASPPTLKEEKEVKEVC
jgi:hypothetical protein